MNVLLALCLLVLQSALWCPSVDARAAPSHASSRTSESGSETYESEESQESQESRESQESQEVTDDKTVSPRHNIAELLLPLIERELSTERRPVHTKKVIQVLPIRGSKEPSGTWPHINSRKKHVVEITPLRGKGRDGQPLAYILSPAKTDSRRAYAKKFDRHHKDHIHKNHGGIHARKKSLIDPTRSSTSESEEESSSSESVEKKESVEITTVASSTEEPENNAQELTSNERSGVTPSSHNSKKNEPVNEQKISTPQSNNDNEGSSSISDSFSDSNTDKQDSDVNNSDESHKLSTFEDNDTAEGSKTLEGQSIGRTSNTNDLSKSDSSSDNSKPFEEQTRSDISYDEGRNNKGISDSDISETDSVDEDNDKDDVKLIDISEDKDSHKSTRQPVDANQFMNKIGDSGTSTSQAKGSDISLSQTEDSSKPTSLTEDSDKSSSLFEDTDNKSQPDKQLKESIDTQENSEQSSTESSYAESELTEENISVPKSSELRKTENENSFLKPPKSIEKSAKSLYESHDEREFTLQGDSAQRHAKSETLKTLSKDKSAVNIENEKIVDDPNNNPDLNLNKNNTDNSENLNEFNVENHDSNEHDKHKHSDDEHGDKINIRNHHDHRRYMEDYEYHHLEHKHVIDKEGIEHTDISKDNNEVTKSDTDYFSSEKKSTTTKYANYPKSDKNRNSNDTLDVVNNISNSEYDPQIYNISNVKQEINVDKSNSETDVESSTDTQTESKDGSVVNLEESKDNEVTITTSTHNKYENSESDKNADKNENAINQNTTDEKLTDMNKTEKILDQITTEIPNVGARISHLVDEKYTQEPVVQNSSKNLESKSTEEIYLIKNSEEPFHFRKAMDIGEVESLTEESYKTGLSTENKPNNNLNNKGNDKKSEEINTNSEDNNNDLTENNIELKDNIKESKDLKGNKDSNEINDKTVEYENPETVKSKNKQSKKYLVDGRKKLTGESSGEDIRSDPELNPAPLPVDYKHRDIIITQQDGINNLWKPEQQRNIIELLPSSAEIDHGTSPSCHFRREAHADNAKHEHKSYRLSFLFNRKK